MKKLITCVLALTILVAQPILASEDVPLNKEPISGGIGHRTPDLVPIQCSYSDGELTFTFSANLGTVECEVVRLSDEATFDAIFYAVNGGSDSLYVSSTFVATAN